MFTKISRNLAVVLLVAMCAIPLTGVGPEPVEVPDLLASEPLQNNPYMTYSNPTSWSVELNSYLVTPETHLEIDQLLQGKSRAVNDLEDAGIVYPIVAASGSSWGVPGREREVSFLIDFDRFDIRVDRHVRQGPRGPEIVFRPLFSGWTKFVRVKISADMVCVDTSFDQKSAERLDWPERWPEEAERFRTPVLDTLGKLRSQRAEMLTSLPDPEAVENLLNTLQGERGEKTLSPVHEAKYLAAGLLGVFEVNQPPMVPTRNAFFLARLGWAERSPARFELKEDGNYDGFNVINPDDAARNLRGSVHDRTAVLTSLYRAAGLPARTVIGLEYKLKGDPIYRSWTEFALYDPDLDLLFWVPVDLNDLATTKVRPDLFRTRWTRFGSSRSLHGVVPISFVFHPHDTNKTNRLPMLVGIRPASGRTEVPLFSEQFMNNRVEPLRPASTNP